ncbi:9914_t:CDS:2, partial [Racocetra persica]
NKLYILGGDTSNINQFTPTKDFFYLDVSVAFNTINIPLTNLSNVFGTPKHSRAAVSAGGPYKDIIFLVGGAIENSSDDTPLVYTFDTIRNVWNNPVIQGIKPPRREYLYSITDVTGKMYIFGGSYNIETGNSNWTFDNRMDILDTIGLTWSKGSQLQAPTSRDGYSVTLLPNGIIAYIGGYVASGPADLKQNTTGTIPISRAHHTSVLGINNDRIIVYGGFKVKTSPIAHDLSVLDIRNKPYEWLIPDISGTIPPTPSRHTANVIGRYMIVTYGIIFLQNYVNPDINILDISNDSEYKWVKSFDPNPSTGIIIGSIIGTAIGSILITIFAFIIYRWCKKRKYAHTIPTHGDSKI